MKKTNWTCEGCGLRSGSSECAKYGDIFNDEPCPACLRHAARPSVIEWHKPSRKPRKDTECVLTLWANIGIDIEAVCELELQEFDTLLAWAYLPTVKTSD